MSASPSDIDPRLDALPAEGKAEYLRWSETYHRLTSSHLANAERLREIRRLDPGHAAIYDWKIDSLLKEAAEVMEQWHGHRRRILEKWLPGHRKNLVFMYSLYESCIMNEISFNVYIEEVLNRIQDSDTDYRSMLPNRIILSSGAQEVA